MKFFKGLFIALPISILMWLLIIRVCLGATYYVDSAITDTNVASATPDFTTYNHTAFTETGGSDSVYKTIADVNLKAFAAGDFVYFRKGQTWREQLTVPSSGSAGNPITFGAYGGGAAPIISGADVVGSWTEDSANVNYGDVTFGSINDADAGNYIYFVNVAVTTGGTVQSITKNSGAASVTAKFAIYTESGGTYTLLSNSVTDELASLSAGANTGTYSGTKPIVSDSTTYYIAILASGDHGSHADGSGTTAYKYKARTYGSGFPATFNTPATLYDPDMPDFYMTVATGSAVLYYKAGYSANPQGIIRNGTLLTNINTKVELDSSTKWWWDDPNDRIYIYGNPSADIVEVATRPNAVHTNSKDYLTFSDLQFESGTGGTFYGGTGSNNITVSGCTIKNFFYGIDVHGSVGNAWLIDNNDIGYGYAFGINATAVSTSGWTISDNTVHHIGLTAQAAPQFIGSNHPSGILVQMANIVLEHNSVHDNGTNVSSDHGIYLFETDDAIIRYNHLYSNACSGLKLYTCVDSQVYYNIFRANEIGMLYQTSSTGGKIWNNIFYNNSTASNYGEGLHISETAVLAELKNNTFLENMYAGNGYYQIIVYDTSEITASDNNLIYASSMDAGKLCSYQGTAKTFAQWQALGFDTLGVNSDPLFVSTVTPDFHLQPGSPAINAGVDVGLTQDYAGTTVPQSLIPDIGAYEYKGIGGIIFGTGGSGGAGSGGSLGF